jgi:DNA-binding PadR family transcriptional regulator
MVSARIPKRRGKTARSAGPLTIADLIVLSLLAERAMHGYELLGEYERQEVVDWASVSKAQVYYAIKKLAGLRLIKPVAGQPGGSDHDRTVYAPTAAGLTQLTASLESEDWARSRVAQPFATWLGLSIHVPARAFSRMIGNRRSFLEAELARERASLAFIKSLETPRARAGEKIVALVIRQIEAELAWIVEMMSAD